MVERPSKKKKEKEFVTVNSSSKWLVSTQKIDKDKKTSKDVDVSLGVTFERSSLRESNLSTLTVPKVNGSTQVWQIQNGWGHYVIRWHPENWP